MTKTERRVQRWHYFWSEQVWGFGADHLGLEPAQWWERAVQIAAELPCSLLGLHSPIPDQCSNPDHDYCAWCMKSMPGQAPRAVGVAR